MLRFNTSLVSPQPGVGPASHSGADVVEGPGGRTALDNKTSLLNTPSQRSFYNPYNYSDTISAYDKAALKETVYEDDVEQLRDGEAVSWV